MLTLAVETSTMVGSLALIHNGRMMDFITWSRAASHGEVLTSSLTALLNKNRKSLHEINLLAVGTGPGSFTGIRVGINFVRTLSYSLNLPVYNLNSLHLLALQAGIDFKQPVKIVQYAFRDLVYTSEFKLDHGRVLEAQAPVAVTFEKFSSQITAPTLIIGTGSELLLNSINPELRSLIVRNPDLSDEPSATFFENSPELDLSHAQLTDWIHTIPLYVRASEAEEKLKTNTCKY